MKRIARISRRAGACALAWAIALAAPLPPAGHLTVALAPLALLVAFGGYMLFLLLSGVLTFRSCPEEAKALQQDIRRAREGLAAIGYSFDGEPGRAEPAADAVPPLDADADRRGRHR